MNKSSKILLFALCMMVSLPAFSQVDLLKRAKKKTERKTDKEVDKKIDEGLDKIFGTGKKSSSGESTENQSGKQSEEMSTKTSEADGATTKVADVESPSGVLNWAKYDFVPGDRVIFEDDLMNEENGEFPSRWDLVNGVAEVAQFDGENVIMLRGGAPSIIPYLEHSDQDYLPDIFTIEFDVYFGGTSGWMEMILYDRKNQQRPRGDQNSMEISYKELSVFNSKSSYPDRNIKRNRWIHIAVAYTSGKFKAYMDDTRLINIPRLDINPSGITLYSYHASDANPIYIKNVRIAKGGVKYYDRVLQDGKIVASGIRFDVGKATILPESMGIINEVVGLMKEHPDLKFSVEGHTDSDGNDEFNMELSKKRAEAVMNEMVKLGIAADRLQAKGWGETRPIAANASPEDKANNRRVEFVKL
jgi:OOP family OmpA-OmpF porin